MITEIPKDAKCQYEDCDAPATRIACGRESYMAEAKRHPNPAVYCDVHASMVTDEGYPEYGHTCPNCGCESGVN